MRLGDQAEVAVDDEIGMHRRDLGVSDAFALEADLVDQPARANSHGVLENASGARLPWL